MAVGVFGEVGDGIGKEVTKAAEGRTAMEGIDWMTQDKSDGRWRRNADRHKLLTEHVVREIVIRRMIVPYDTVAILQMPTYTPIGSRSRNTLQITIPSLSNTLRFIGKHP